MRILRNMKCFVLESLSGKVEKYTAERNWDYLHESGLKSFLYQSWAHRYVSASNITGNSGASFLGRGSCASE